MSNMVKADIDQLSQDITRIIEISGFSGFLVLFDDKECAKAGNVRSPEDYYNLSKAINTIIRNDDVEGPRLAACCRLLCSITDIETANFNNTIKS